MTGTLASSPITSAFNRSAARLNGIHNGTTSYSQSGCCFLQ
jgi:hypothetical protein